MTVNFNSEESSLFTLIGGGPQGSWTSNVNADFVTQEDRYKYSDDLSILEIVMLGDILIENDFINHVASDIGVGQLFLPNERLITQENLEKISDWTVENKMLL